MDYITSEQYEEYIKVLNYDYKIIDIKILTTKYIFALYEYVQTQQDDINLLKLITDAFCYLSNFDLYINSEEIANIIEETKKIDNEEYKDYQMVAVLIYKIVSTKYKKKVFDCNTIETLNKLLSTILPIKQYEKENGNIKTMSKQLEENKSI